MKLFAGGLLVLAAVVYVVCRLVGGGHGGWGYVQAAAEASMVGGLADWFAVTALFRHPLGLPIPHTAIIPRKKDQIGAALADFVQELPHHRDRRRAHHGGAAAAARGGVAGDAGARRAARRRAERRGERPRRGAGGQRAARRGRGIRGQAAARAGRGPACWPGCWTRSATRAAPEGARRGAARADALPRRQPGGVPRPDRRGVAGVGARLGGPAGCSTGASGCCSPSSPTSPPTRSTSCGSPSTPSSGR